MTRRKLAALAVAGLVLPLAAASSAQADTTCTATAESAIVADHVSCGVAGDDQAKATHRARNTGNLHPSVNHAGHYWRCTVKLRDTRGSVACAYDSRHAVAFSMRFA
jgi:hypothetical protein